MKVKLITTCLLATALSVMTASAFFDVTVACPSGLSASGIHVCAVLTTDSKQFACGDTDANGFVQLGPFANIGTYMICVDTKTLPPGATLSQACQLGTLDADHLEVTVQFELTGSFCSGPPPSGPCWETGGGTLDKSRGKPVWSFGGVIYPGCSSAAAGGGNLNIVNHITGLHFNGTDFVVDDCRADFAMKLVSVPAIHELRHKELFRAAGSERLNQSVPRIHLVHPFALLRNQCARDKWVIVVSLDFVHQFSVGFSHRKKAAGFRHHDTGNVIEQSCGHVARGLNDFGRMVDNRRAEAIHQLNKSRDVPF
jgi:hypothetical protein